MGQKIVEKFSKQSATAADDVGWMFYSRFSGPRLPFEFGSFEPATSAVRLDFGCWQPLISRPAFFCLVPSESGVIR